LSLGAGRLRRTLVVIEVALAMTLLAGAGLLVRSLARLTAVDPGFRPDHLGTFSVTLSPVRYPDAARQEQFARALEARLARLPGVTSAGISFSLPLTNTAFGFTFSVGGRPPVTGPDEPRAQARVATPDYFRTMGIPLLRGRGFTARDDETAPHVILISQETARRYWPNEDPIGQTLQTGWGRDPAHHFGGTIIGIVGDVRQFSLAMAPRPEIYGPLAQRPIDELSVVMRSTGATPTALAAARDVVRELDSELPVYDVRTYADIVRESIAERRFYVTLLATFAGLALALAAIGIYGVIAYSVQQRRRELGIRIALGATRERVIGLVMRQGMTLATVGAAIGLAVAALLTRLLRGQLYDVSATDPLTFVLVPVILVVVAAIACVVPARRALAVDPATTIRAES
jgi:putative ABC transport system permease protein